MKEGYWKKGMSKYCSKTMCTHHNNKQIHAQTRKKVYVIQFLVFVLLLIFSNKALVYCILLWIFTTVHHATLKTHIFDHLIRLLTNFFILFFQKGHSSFQLSIFIYWGLFWEHYCMKEQIQMEEKKAFYKLGFKQEWFRPQISNRGRYSISNIN